MTNELKINDIEYFQGDLLDMNKLNKKFDFIDCSGVLHHLEDPILGWKSLIKHLHPGGVMRVSLYSKIARKDVLSFRELMKKKDVKYSKNLLLKIREEIIKGQYLGSKNFCAFSDFYTTSELRDLLFHFIEHQFSLTEIKTILQKLCLNFVGLEVPAYIKQKFSMKYSSREDFLDLEKWHNFELEFPETFISMYRLWCHKK